MSDYISVYNILTQSSLVVLFTSANISVVYAHVTGPTASTLLAHTNGVNRQA